LKSSDPKNAAVPEGNLFDSVSEWSTNLPESEGRFSKESNVGMLVGFSQLCSVGMGRSIAL
jgi:hypothetical protein